MVAAAAVAPCQCCFVPSVDEPPTRPRKQECIHVFTFILSSPCAWCWCLGCWTTPKCVRNVYAMLVRLPNEVIWELMPNEHRDYHLEQKWRIWTSSNTAAAHKHTSRVRLFFFLDLWVSVCVWRSCAIPLTCCVDTKSPIFDGVLCCVLFFRMPQRRLHSHCNHCKS